MLLSKINMRYSKKEAKKTVCLFIWDYMINYTESEGENR